MFGIRSLLYYRAIHQCVMEGAPAPRKTMVSSRSFGRRVSRKEDLPRPWPCTAPSPGRGCGPRAMQVWMMTSRHMDEPYCGLTAHINLHLPTTITDELIATAGEALDRCCEPGHGFMKGGRHHTLRTERRRPPPDDPDGGGRNPGAGKKKSPHAGSGPDQRQVRADIMRFAAQGQQDAFWHMRREKMSGHLTTRWDQLPKVGG